MKAIVVGMGIQGAKRLAFAGADAAATVDPFLDGADYKHVQDVPLGAYDAALVCTPDGPKVELLTYLLGHGKHVLVEKPLIAPDNAALETLRAISARTGAVCYTAYNHRFEPHLVTVKRHLDEGRIGRVYHCRMFYGNGTARDVRNSPWRDRGLGVIPDLASHMLDLCEFFVGRPRGEAEMWMAQRYENAAPDYFLMGYGGSQPAIKLEGTLLSWRNTFGLDIIGERGSIHVTGLCKWGPSTLVVRGRVLPSGRPPEEVETIEMKDPTWALEYDHFTRLCETGGTNIDTDVWINGVLNGLGASLPGLLREPRPTRSDTSACSKRAPADSKERRGVMPTVGFAGLSHLGLVSAAALASKGVTVVAFDPDAGLVAAIQRGSLPVVEPGLAELVASPQRPAWTADAADLRRCDVVYVALDVATDDAGQSDLGPLRHLIDLAWPHLRGDATLVILSQVPPGFTRQLAGERMAASPPEGPGALYYQVETLIFGRAVERALQPERYMIGCADPAQPLPAPLVDVLGIFGCPVLPMRYESAELAKISINLFLVSSISTTNMLAEVCEQVGADWSEIAPALRLDARIGAKAYLDPGLGFGGGNLGRDLATVKRMAAAHGTDTRIIDAWRANSSYRRDWALRLLRSDILERTPDARLAVWGVAYKQDTASTKNSPSVALLEALGHRRVTAFDPAAQIPEGLRDHVAAAADPIAACRDADVLLVMTPWPEFREVPLNSLVAAMRGRTIVDPNGVIDRQQAAALGFTHYRLGAPASGGPEGPPLRDVRLGAPASRTACP